MIEVRCSGCGSLVTYDPKSPPITDHCYLCPPETCADCGGINHTPTNRMCKCWVSIEDLSLADKKALFAADGTFNVETDGSISLGKS